MNKKVLRYAYDSVISAAESLCCKDLHHTNKQHHEQDEICKAEYKLHKQVQILRDHMKELGL